MNWKHTRSEVDQVLEAAKLLKLAPDETRDAILASVFSDSIKNRGNFIVHNVHSAQGAALALSYFMNCGNPKDMRSIERIHRAVLEHQIAPPQFMARAVAILLCKQLNIASTAPWDDGDRLNGQRCSDARLVASIYSKIADPLNKAHLCADWPSASVSRLTSEGFVDIEELPSWYVPHPGQRGFKNCARRHCRGSFHQLQSPGRFRQNCTGAGPDTEAIFEDATIHNSARFGPWRVLPIPSEL